MKKTFIYALIVTCALALSWQPVAFSQQKAQSQTTGSNSTGRGPGGAATTARRSARVTSGSIPVIERDFDEAVRVIQENYIEGKKLDYNSIVKSSIIGMLRTLDPHSNYYDREEFDELKTDQRSEYFGIGASIQNYLLSDQTDTFITATFQN